MLDIEKLEEQLFEMQDLKYRDFHSKLLPGIDKETLIGIRTPMLRKFSREFAKTPEAEEFLQVLPHRYYDRDRDQRLRNLSCRSEEVSSIYK